MPSGGLVPANLTWSPDVQHKEMYLEVTALKVTISWIMFQKVANFRHLDNLQPGSSELWTSYLALCLRMSKLLRSSFDVLTWSKQWDIFANFYTFDDIGAVRLLFHQIKIMGSWPINYINQKIALLNYLLWILNFMGHNFIS